MSKKLLSIMALFIVSLLAVSMVSADTTMVEMTSVKINGDNVDFANGERVKVHEGETLDIRVGLISPIDIDDVEVEAEISGEDEDFDVSVHEENLEANTTEYFDLEIDLPRKLEQTEYSLRIRVMTRTGGDLNQIVRLSVEPETHGLDIADVVFSPGNTVKAGRSLLTSVLLQNYGEDTEEDVKVTVAIPALGVQATEFVDKVETDDGNIDYEDVPEMFLQVPATAAAGQYDVVVTVKYDNLEETVTTTYPINVVANEMFQAQEKLVLAVGPELQSVVAGQTATFAVALTNAGSASKAYILKAVTGGDWATASLSENLVVLEPGKNAVVYVTVNTASGADAGEHLVSLTVESGDGDVLQTIPLRTVVSGEASVGDGVSLRNGLEIALIVVVVLLVIIGLIVGFSRLRKDEDEEDQTYY
ncbi:MAG: hypothetical protein KKH52_03165 [Nanoarchaeota archaeon]|nr:hypothetical protein [Nanoarchaeota archaeon]MBU1622015.1 hypothetical protein [Nanoarchaeota archaeon]MBU1974369.1 hypothetical protein [Nanoarchaeota archaeon]